jgi:hypothetical protein
MLPGPGQEGIHVPVDTFQLALSVSLGGGGVYHRLGTVLTALTMLSTSFLHSSSGGGAGHVSGGSLIHGSPSWYGVPGPKSLGSTVGLVPMSARFSSLGSRTTSSPDQT